jgi:hypothetical protein
MLSSFCREMVKKSVMLFLAGMFMLKREMSLNLRLQRLWYHTCVNSQGVIGRTLHIVLLSCVTNSTMFLIFCMCSRECVNPS